MFCPLCGKAIPTDSQFCLHCGKPVGKPAIAGKNTEWEYRDFTYKFDPPPGRGMWAKLGKDGFSEDGARQQFWQNSRSQILSELQKWIDRGWQPVSEVGSACIEIKMSKSHKDKSPGYWLIWIILSLPSFGMLLLFALLAVSIIAEPMRFVLQVRAPKGTKAPGFEHATFRIPADELKKWRNAFVSLGWFEELGSQTKQTLSRLFPLLDIASEPLIFVAYSDTRGNHISKVQIDTASLRPKFMAVIATEWRIIFVDTDNLRPYAFPYGDIASIEKPEEAKKQREIQYVLYTKSGHTIRLTIQLDAPNVTGLLNEFYGQAISKQAPQYRIEEEVLKFFNLFFTRIIPSTEGTLNNEWPPTDIIAVTKSSQVATSSQVQFSLTPTANNATKKRRSLFYSLIGIVGFVVVITIAMRLLYNNRQALQIENISPTRAVKSVAKLPASTQTEIEKIVVATTAPTEIALPTFTSEIPLEEMANVEGTYTRKSDTIIRGTKYPNALYFDQERIIVRLLQQYQMLTMKVGVDDQAGQRGWKHFWVKNDKGQILFDADAKPFVEPVALKVDISHTDWIEITALDYNGQTPAYIRWIDVNFLSSAPLAYIQPTSISLTPTLSSGLIPFASSKDSNILNPIFEWQRGGSSVSAYNLNAQSNELILVAGPRTWQEQSGMPMVIYPYSGDFDVQVKANRLPEFAQSIGIGVRPKNEPSFSRWFLTMKHLDQRGRIIWSGIYPTKVNFALYSDSATYLRVKRQGSLFSSMYSTNGSDWVELFQDLVLEMPQEEEIFLFVYSTTNDGIEGEFYDFTILSATK